MSQAASLNPTMLPPVPSDPDSLYEIVNGQRVELPPMSIDAVLIASVLTQLLGPFARDNQLGRVVSEMLFDFGREEVPRRRPDVAFVSYQRSAKNRRVPSTAAWAVVPELAVEVISPTDLVAELFLKIREYFQAGVQLVWVVFPSEEQVYVYESPTQVHILTRSAELDGGKVLPDFRLPLSALFEEAVAGE